MPRPALKRKPYVRPTAIQRVASNSSSSPRLELEQKLKSKAIGIRPNDSDDSDKLVTAVAGKLNRKRVGRQEIYASGAVAAADTPGAHPSRRKSKENIARSNVSNRLQSTQNGRSSLGNLADPSPLYQSQSQSQTEALAKTRSSSPVYRVRRTKVAPTPLKGTPGAGASILGTFKQRPRQNSILHFVGNDESSNLSLDDEAEFLPDAESTPLNLKKNGAESSTLSSLSQVSNPRKRKISSLATPREDHQQLDFQGPSHESNAARSIPPEPELPSMPTTSPLSKVKKAKEPRLEGDIMAPPESSSSPGHSPVKVKTTPVTEAKGKGKRKADSTKPLSTEQLQSMMPKRPNNRTRRNKLAGEFDIPSDPSASEEIPRPAPDEEESFAPVSKSKKRKPDAIREGKVNTGRTQRATSTVSPTEGNRNRFTKSPSQQLSSKTAKPSSKTYGSRRPPGQRSGFASDKENRRGDSSVALDEGRGSGLDNTGSPINDTMQVFKNQFAEIDEWNMEFEEVDISSSDPMMR